MAVQALSSEQLPETAKYWQPARAEQLSVVHGLPSSQGTVTPTHSPQVAGVTGRTSVSVTTIALHNRVGATSCNVANIRRTRIVVIAVQSLAGDAAAGLAGVLQAAGVVIGTSGVIGQVDATLAVQTGIVGTWIVVATGQFSAQTAAAAAHIYGAAHLAIITRQAIGVGRCTTCRQVTTVDRTGIAIVTGQDRFGFAGAGNTGVTGSASIAI